MTANGDNVEQERCPDCNGGGTIEGSHCPTCGQRRYDTDPCPRCNGTGQVAGTGSTAEAS